MYINDKTNKWISWPEVLIQVTIFLGVVMSYHGVFALTSYEALTRFSNNIQMETWIIIIESRRIPYCQNYLVKT